MLVGLDNVRPGLARPVNRRLESKLEIFAHRLPVTANLSGNRYDAQPLLLQIVNQDDLAQSFHLALPPLLFAETIR